MTDAPAFSVLLREATRTEHGDAENRGFITRLMGGELAEADDWRLLEQYLPIYATLEERMRQIAAVDPLAAFLHDPRLERSAAIRADLAARFGEGHTPATPLPATERCTARLAIADTPALVAHHYLRYLGDLSGGQAIGALVARHYGVPAEQLSMWDFSAVGAPKRVKDRYRDSLDRITDPAVQQAIIAEAVHGFSLASGTGRIRGARTGIRSARGR